MKYGWTQSLFSAIIRKPMENPIVFLSRNQCDALNIDTALSEKVCFCLIPLKIQTHHLCTFNTPSTVDGDDAPEELFAIKQEEAALIPLIYI